MKFRLTLTTLPILVLALTAFTVFITDWLVENHKAYNLFYAAEDKQNTKEYATLIDNGMHAVNTFFSSSYKRNFDVYIHPNRKSLDQQWQKDWGMPDFKSECWMVASGVATKLDVISPKQWEKESCEHSFSDRLKTEQLITHELVHVYHGQQNVSADFSDVYDIDWFVEGLATYAAGQFDATRIDAVKKLIAESKEPKSLNDFWKGNLKYGLSGSVVMCIDHTYGRSALNGLLTFNKKTEILKALNVTEEDLLTKWRDYITHLSAKN